MNLHANCVMILEPTWTEYSCFEVMGQLLYHICSCTLFDVWLVTFFIY